MAIFRCRSFLGCLPLKTGACCLAVLGMMAGGLGAAGSWLEVYWTTHHPLDLLDKAALMARAVVFSLLLVLSFFGFAAAIKNTRSGVYICGKFIFIHTTLISLSFAFTIYSTLRTTNQEQVTKCINGSNGTSILQFCNKGWSLIKILPVALFGLTLIAQFYAWIIALSYADELDIDGATRKFSALTIGEYHGTQNSDIESDPRGVMYPEPPFPRR
ncbi:hypothetical protein B0H10DRAFT_794444 [Mycena sp. CBHHK59/15]|nr:hypothetical protein B0H10DRAFT_794444 [Mycena sp. CBHHK59/15]